MIVRTVFAACRAGTHSDLHMPLLFGTAVPQQFHNGGYASHEARDQGSPQSFSGDQRACLRLCRVVCTCLSEMEEPGPGLLTAGP